MKYVPDLHFHLISVRAIGTSGKKVEFFGNNCSILIKGRQVASGTLKNNLYILDTAKVTPSHKALVSAPLSLWHDRLGHVQSSGIEQIIKNNVVTGASINGGLIIQFANLV